MDNNVPYARNTIGSNSGDCDTSYDPQLPLNQGTHIYFSNFDDISLMTIV